MLSKAMLKGGRPNDEEVKAIGNAAIVPASFCAAAAPVGAVEPAPTKKQAKAQAVKESDTKAVLLTVFGDKAIAKNKGFATRHGGRLVCLQFPAISQLPKM